MTRGIRVETAAIIIITLFGIISQLKVWKIIKRKREERAAETLKKEHERDLSDEEQGKKVEADNQQDRPLWEALHGDKSGSKVQAGYLDSGIGTEAPSSTRQSSVGNARISNDEGIEMHDMPGSTNGPHDGGRLTVHVAQDDFFYDIPTHGGQRSSVDHSVVGSSTSAPKASASIASTSKETTRISPKALDPNLTLQPKVVPPPFRIPDLDSASDDGGSSIAASAPTEHLPDRGSKRFSGSSIGRRLSKRSRVSYVANGTSEEALVVPHIEDDRASSLAATADGVSDQGDDDEVMNYSRSGTPVIENILDGASLEALQAASHRSNRVSQSAVEDPAESGSADREPASVALPDSRPVSVAGAEQLRDGSQHELGAASKTTSETSEQRKERVRLSGNLPEGGSKVVTAYRTNEWAKHLESAEAPIWDTPNVDRKPSPGQPPKGEAAAPLDVRALQETPLSAEPAPAVMDPKSKISHLDLPSSKARSSHLMSRNPFSRHSKQQKQPPKHQPVLHPLTIAKNNERTPNQGSPVVSRTSSQTSLNSTIDTARPPLPKFRSSQASLTGLNRLQRSSSTPLASPLVESPIEEGVESSFPATRFTPHDAHLMSQRDRIISSKPSSTSLLRTSYSNVALDQHPAYRTINEDDDNLPLAQRRSLLQQNPQSNPMTRRSSSALVSGATTPRHRSGTTTPALGSTNPYRSSSTPQLSATRPAMPTQRDSTISAWRTSLKPDTTAHYEQQTMETRRADLLREKQRQSTSRMEGELKQVTRNSAIDQRMRRGDMMNAHANAMRKLQGEAKV